MSKDKYYVTKWVMDQALFAVEAEDDIDAVDKANCTDRELLDRGPMMDICPTTIGRPDGQDVVLVSDLDLDELRHRLWKVVSQMVGEQTHEDSPYTVIGYYSDGKIFVDHVWAASGEEAGQKLAGEKGLDPDEDIYGVFAGRLTDRSASS